MTDFCAASYYFEVMEREPTLMPVFLDEFEILKVYYKKVYKVLKDSVPELRQRIHDYKKL